MLFISDSATDLYV